MNDKQLYIALPGICPQPWKLHDRVNTHSANLMRLSRILKLQVRRTMQCVFESEKQSTDISTFVSLFSSKMWSFIVHKCWQKNYVKINCLSYILVLRMNHQREY